MVQIENNQGAKGYKSVIDLLAKQRAERRPVAEGQQDANKPKGREIYDTVEISGAGKVVNLARGNDLAKEIRQEKDPNKVADMMAAGTKDIQRVTRLLFETFKAMRGYFRR